MPTEADPIVNNWYTHLDKGQRFCVVSANEDDGVVEMQFFDGTVEEIDWDQWYQLDIEPSEAPENWTGADDIVEVDDLGTAVTDTTVSDWNEPAQEFRTEPEQEDDWGEGKPKEEPWEGEL